MAEDKPSMDNLIDLQKRSAPVILRYNNIGEAKPNHPSNKFKPPAQAPAEIIPLQKPQK